MESKFFLFTILVALNCVVALNAQYNSAPQFLRIVEKPKSTWVQIQAQRLLVHGTQEVFEPCYRHAVQFRELGTNQQKWDWSNVTEIAGGQFILPGLNPGKSYEVRVACKDDRVSQRPGEWSDPLEVNTPLTNPKESHNHDIDGYDENGGSSVSAPFLGYLFVLYTPVLLKLIITS